MRYLHRSCLVIAGVALALASPALAWDAHGHRTISLLAQDGFAKLIAEATSPLGGVAGTADAPAPKPTEPLPAWLTTERSRAMVAFQSSEPDRYRGTRSAYLKHENDPDHYIDIEDLELFGLTLTTIPPLRYEYLRAMAVAKHEHYEPAPGLPPYNEKTDTARTQEWPGYAPYAIMEHHAKLTSAFKTLRTVEREADPSSTSLSPRVEMARANVLAEMGHLAHFVGDVAQPLHTTRHHHGWVGENPKGYTTDKGFHAYIDGTILTIHSLTYDSLKPDAKFDLRIDPIDPWKDVIAEIQRSFDQLEPLYQLNKSGALTGPEGKTLITARLHDAASTLAALYASAWRASTPSERDLSDFQKFDK